MHQSLHIRGIYTIPRTPLYTQYKGETGAFRSIFGSLWVYGLFHKPRYTLHIFANHQLR